MDRSTDPGRAPECFEFDSSDKTNTVVTLREGFTLEGVCPETPFSPPVGFIYVQFPGKTDPATLFGLGTWSNISSSFAGNFFRAEGGKASVFGGGTQAQDIQPHTHVSYGRGVTAQVVNSGGDYVPPASSDTLESRTTSSTGSVETRPVNMTVRIWERIA